MKAVGDSVLVFTLVCLLGCCLRIGAQGETTDCCSLISSSNGTTLEWKRLCNKTCGPGYYPDGVRNDAACLSGSTTGKEINGTTTTVTTTTTASVYLLCKPCADGCKNCNRSSVCSECHVTCAEKAKPDDTLPIIIGASVGGVVFIVVVVLVIIFCCRRCRRRSQFKAGDQEVGAGIVPTDDDSEAEFVTSPEAVDAGRKVSARKGPEEPNYVNMPKHAVRPFSIEKSHDKVLRYTRDPTIKNVKRTEIPPQSEEAELEHLPPAPKPPSKLKNPPRDVYEIVDTEADREKSKLRQASAAAAPQELYVDVDNTKPKPSPKPKPKPKPNPKPGKAPAEPEPSPQPTYVPFGLPMSKKAARSKTTTAIGPHVHKGGRRKTGGSSPNPESYPNPASPVSCPELPKFPIEQAGAKKKQPPTPLKPKKTFSQPPAAVNVDDESDPEEGYENAPKKKTEPHHKNGQTIPNTDDDDSDPEADYENAPKDKGPLAAMDPGKIQPHGTDNPAADMELEDPQQVYGNQDVIEDVERKSGRGHRNTGRAAVGRATEADSDPGDDYEEMADSKAASNTTMEEDEDQHTYGNNISDEESPEQPYQNVSFPKKS